MENVAYFSNYLLRLDVVAHESVIYLTVPTSGILKQEDAEFEIGLRHTNIAVSQIKQINEQIIFRRRSHQKQM